MNKKDMMTLLSNSRKKYMELQEEQEVIYQKLLERLDIGDEPHYDIFDYLANDFLTTRQTAARIELIKADEEAEELRKKEENQKD